MAAILMKAGDLKKGDMNAVKVNDREILLVNADGRVYGYENLCTHGGCRLQHGTLSGGRITCPCHGSVFDATTGAVLDGPATSPQPAIPVIVKDGGIYLA